MLERLTTAKNLLTRSSFHYFRMAMLHPPYHLSVNGKNTKIFADDNSGSATCYREVIAEDCYNLVDYAKHHKPSLIVDIGANVGVFSKFCSLLFPEAKIHSYEPNPTAQIWLERNSKDTLIQVHPFAVAKEACELSLEVNCDSTIGYLSPNGSLLVQCIPSSEVVKDLPIDLLKMDCEGSEWSIFQDTTLLKRTKYLCMEYHLYDNHTIEELTELIESANHEILHIKPNKGYNGKFGLLWSEHKCTSN